MAYSHPTQSSLPASAMTTEQRMYEDKMAAVQADNAKRDMMAAQLEADGNEGDVFCCGAAACKKGKTSLHFEDTDGSSPHSGSGSRSPSLRPLYRPEDPLHYAVDVYLWRHEQQHRFFVPDPLAAQGGEITPHARSTLLRWLAEVARRFRYAADTFCLAASFLDRFLSLRQLHRDCLQLAGAAALLIAAKVEEVEPPEIPEVVALCGRRYDDRQVRWMEFILLAALRFELSSPTAAFFLAHLVEMEGMSPFWPRRLARRMLERSVCEYEVSRRSLPSQIGHAVFNAVARRIFADRRLEEFAQDSSSTRDYLIHGSTCQSRGCQSNGGAHRG